MATTAKGTPYVVSTDLVANYPTVSSDLADHIDDNLAYNAVSINAQTGTTYTFALADASEGKLVTASNAAASTYTVPPQSSVTWATGAVLRILNQGAGTVTIAAGSGVTINGTPLTLAQYKGAAIQRTASNTWTFIPFSGGVGSAIISNTPTGSYTGYQYWSYTASGTLTCTTSGNAQLLLVGGGGGGGEEYAGGGGAGEHMIADVFLVGGTTYTVTVGAGGAGGIGGSNSGSNGNHSLFGQICAIGGGGGGGQTLNGKDGASGGGAGGDGANLKTGGVALQRGNNGGNNFPQNFVGPGGGGGGSGGAGVTATSSVAGNGGAGTANDYTGTSVTRAGGGGGSTISGTQGTGQAGGGNGNYSGTGGAGTANTGSGGGAGGNGGAGGSGIVVIRVAV